MSLTEEGIKQGKYKPCLEYHIHNCKGPCIGKQTVEDYQEAINQAREVLKGNSRELSKSLYEKMVQKASEMKFEEAEDLKHKVILLETFVAKSEVVSHTITDIDVFSIVDDTERTHAFINYMHVTNGTVNQSFTYEYKRKLDESDEELLLEAIPEIRERFKSTAKEIIVPFEIDWKMPDGSEFFVPQRGDKHHLLELSEMNCKQYKVDRLKQSEKFNPEQRATRLMTELKNKLNLPALPMVIEAFDNSNISGSDAVAACVVYKKMKPSKSDYRKYNIKTVEGPDDYASMQEVVRRRYSPFSEQIGSLVQGASEGAELPDLIVCDGGTGQMHCVAEVVWGELGLKIPISGLAKDNRHRTNELLYLPLTEGRLDPSISPVTVQIKPESELFRVLTQLQDEVHRFAITFHRDKRSKSALHSVFDDIKGIGPKTAGELLKHFKSVKRIREATLEDIASVIGESKAKIIKENLKT